MKKIHVTEHIPGLDDYELPNEFPFDRAKMKPNRFATRGGKHARSGRKLAPIVRKTITLTQPHLAYLRTLDSNVSRAIRKLIDTAKFSKA